MDYVRSRYIWHASGKKGTGSLREAAHTAGASRAGILALRFQNDPFRCRDELGREPQKCSEIGMTQYAYQSPNLIPPLTKDSEEAVVSGR